MRRLAAPAVLALVLLCAAPAPASGVTPVTHVPPVDAPIVELFRPPASRFGPGNRGIDYATVPGTEVRSSAPGEVTFAGAVGGTFHVVVLHADGIRTSYSFLSSVSVGRGVRVVAGQVVGVSGPSLHFGARAGDTYLDPLLLLGGGRPKVRLVPDEAGRPQDESTERSHLERMLRALPRVGAKVGGAAVGWARELATAATGRGPGSEELLAVLHAVGPPVWFLPARLALATRAWADSQAACTPAEVRPPVPSERRQAVLVAGLGSTSSHAAVDELDTAALGYARADVVRFSYRGGTTAERPYAAADTQQDIRTSGRRLRLLLERLHADRPGVPIDVIAHSQGGLVARSALGGRAPPMVGHLITLGTPHQGADLATGARAASSSPGAVGVARLARATGLTGIDPRSPAVRQLSETSTFIRDLGSLPLPEGVRVVSVAARGDAVVASPRSRLRGAANVVVTVPVVSQHSALPGSAAAAREVALALRGRPPSCETWPDAMADEVVGQAIAGAEDVVGLALASVAR
ncbi:MAG: peptidoglycan DD-metalloendopeptidase family protein [Actinomycetota bacterium]|nr:peptidoglycan DD-metalloendopeptidase family protein [Actinomycetota bacterium]